MSRAKIPLVFNTEETIKELPVAVIVKKRKGEKKQKILEAIKESNKPIRPINASELAGVNKNTARWCCLKLYAEGKIERTKRGYYALKK